jgi:hypothetical protein
MSAFRSALMAHLPRCTVSIVRLFIIHNSSQTSACLRPLSSDESVICPTRMRHSSGLYRP